MTQSFTGTEAIIERLTLETNVASIEATANLDRATDSFTAKACTAQQRSSESRTELQN